MRTGTLSLTWMMRRAFGIDAVFPADGGEPVDFETAMLEPAYVAGLDHARMDTLRFAVGHFPYSLAERMPEFTPCTVLRDPVERAASMLRMTAAMRPKPIDWEELLAEPVTAALVSDHQTRLLGSTWGEGWPRPAADPFPLTDAHLARARAAIAEIPLLGVFDHYHAFLHDVFAFVGLQDPEPMHMNEASEIELPASVMATLVDRNRADVQLFAAATEEWHRRR